MNKLILFLALAVSLFTTVNLHADDINLALTTGTNVDVLNQVSAGEWTYTDTYLSLLDGGLLSLVTNTVTITYADVTGLLGVLNVNDVCTSTQVLATPAPCQQFALSYTNLTLPDLSVAAAVGIDVDLGIGAALDFGSNTLNLDLLNLSVAGGNATINATSPVPEPATLSLLATGLVGAAGAMRRRFAASRA